MFNGALPRLLGLWLEPVFSIGRWVIESYFVIREVVHFQLFLAVTPELQLLCLVFYILIVFIGSSHVTDSNLKNLVIIQWI
jgi:hypothetical protein